MQVPTDPVTPNAHYTSSGCASESGGCWEPLTASLLDSKGAKKYLADLGSDWELKDGKVVRSFQLFTFT